MGLLFLSSCATHIDDFTACLDLGSAGHCAHFLTDETYDVEGVEWEQMRVGRASISVEDLVNIKAEIEKLCSKTKCTQEQKEQVQSFYDRLDLH